MTISGIYTITNKTNGKIYVGSSNRVKVRWGHHKSNLKNKRHCNIHLQRAYDKSGLLAFVFEIVKEVEEAELLTEEQKMLDTLQPFGERGYNIARTAGSPMTGRTHTEEVKQILREKLSGEKHPHYGKPVSEAWRRKISKANKRFTDEEERALLIRNENGESLYKIGRELNTHPMTISRAIQRAKRFGYC
jgi:group I intron endonuclease